jgi:toxin CcdB
MARFDVHEAGSGRGFLLICQADALDHLSTRVVVPLMHAGNLPQVGRLNPLFEVDGKPVVMSTHLIFSIPKSRLGKKIGSLANDHDVIVNALDLLITGF